MSCGGWEVYLARERDHCVIGCLRPTSRRKSHGRSGGVTGGKTVQIMNEAEILGSNSDSSGASAKGRQLTVGIEESGWEQVN